ncbi:hypothetical protein PHMEG_00035979 [Phytophthora megakarya]|uniref:Uncharacterized protein n=1 Tax=Phytophthora megakarya TaxID=4795 RepID=A0A225UMG7_9STRA|nr:hypothetical protein PHMEG_00035979 [Phytophthora megakarya]
MKLNALLDDITKMVYLERIPKKRPPPRTYFDYIEGPLEASKFFRLKYDDLEGPSMTLST